MPTTPRLLLALLGFPMVAWAAEFPTPRNSGINDVAPEMTAGEALDALTLPQGFSATVFAAEPDVQNPIAMAWDSRGRLWIAENYTYAERGVRYDLKNRDRVLLFEDAAGTGRFSSRRVFVDDVQRLTSVAIGHGGVWLMCPPHLLFVPDRDADGVPDGPAEVKLDGFSVGVANYHTIANGLRFGPDGWLYGRCGTSSVSEIGLPGSAPETRIPLRGTIWRYHPQRNVVEVLMCGTTNPWGHDWDRHGELFFINTVNGHLWHGITGAHYTRPHTIDPNPHVHQLIDQHADHYHFDYVDARSWTLTKDGAANAHGGGHAHVGMMIYQGDNWPAAYRDRLFTLSFHGRRMNQDILERRGSGYIGRHGEDVVLFGDRWFRGIELGYGPDGGVFILDWSDMGDCHNAMGVNRLSGRIFKIVHGQPKRNGPADLTKLAPLELAELHKHPNEWFVRQARIELATRAAAGREMSDAVRHLSELFERGSDAPQQLRALWTLYAIGAAEPAFLHAQLGHANEHVRAWAIRLLTDTWPLDTVMSQRPLGRSEKADMKLVAEFAALARTEPSALVRLALASALQRIPPRDRAPLAAALTSHAENADDHNLPAMIWYGLIPTAEIDPGALTDVAAECELPATRQAVMRRLFEDLDRYPAAVDRLIAAAARKPGKFQEEMIATLAEGLAGWQKMNKPAAWDEFVALIEPAASPKVRDQLRTLNALFGDGRALEAVKAVALDPRANLGSRKAALRALIEARPPDLWRICDRLVRIRGLGPMAAQGILLFDTPEAAQRLAASYLTFVPVERPALIAALVSRPLFARALLQAIASGRIPRADLTAFHARQIASFNDAELTRELTQMWGELRETPAEKRASLDRLTRELTAEALAQANKSAGRVLFNQLCASCHRLYGEGQTLGPDLTGGQRHDLSYLLDNIVDPSAVVTTDFRNTVVKLKDGRTLNGFVTRRTERSLTLRSMTEELSLDSAEIEAVETSAQSMMPDGLLEALTPQQRRDLIGYLMHPTQAPLP